MRSCLLPKATGEELMSLLSIFGLNSSSPLLRNSRHRAYVNKTFAAAYMEHWKPPWGELWNLPI
jgi:hypothetical protein